MDAATMAWFDQEDARITDTIRQHGWAITYVGGHDCGRPGCAPAKDAGPSFAYTVGMFGLGHPELLVFDLSPHETVTLLNSLGQRIRSGDQLIHGVAVEVEEFGRTVIPETVPNPGEIVFEANRFYQRPDEASVAVLQLSHPDANGRFPGDPDFDSPDRQPRPGTFRA